MTKILLICSAGMSTSMLVNKMKTAATEANVEAEIWAVGDADKALHAPKADVILLGPQVRFMKSTIEELVDGKKPVLVIDMSAYGSMNGKKVLESALEALK